MIRKCLIVFLLCGLCCSDQGDLGYELRIGHAIDVFANYGDLSQVTQVVSADYEEEVDDQNAAELFREKNIKVFADAPSQESNGDPMVDMNILLCDTFDELLSTYFQNFKIEGTDTPWKAFMGDWIPDEIKRTFGLESDFRSDNCCYALVKMRKVDRSVKLGDLSNVTVKDYVTRAIDKLNVSDPSKIRQFMRSYGTHYIDSYETGNFIYQVFKYKRSGYNMFKSYIRTKNSRGKTADNLRFYFSSFLLQQVGDIRVASGNKTIEAWARNNLRDSRYLYFRPSLIKLHYNPILAHKLNYLLDNGALLGLGLKTSRSLFKDKLKAEKYAEVVENDLQLWENNA